MKGNVKSRLQIYYQELEKFKARWDQLKPGDDIIEAGQHNTLDRSAKLIKEKKIEFDDLEVIRKKLVYVFFFIKTGSAHFENFIKLEFSHVSSLCFLL